MWRNSEFMFRLSALNSICSTKLFLFCLFLTQPSFPSFSYFTISFSVCPRLLMHPNTHCFLVILTTFQFSKHPYCYSPHISLWLQGGWAKSKVFLLEGLKQEVVRCPQKIYRANILQYKKETAMEIGNLRCLHSLSWDPFQPNSFTKCLTPFFLTPYSYN